MTYLRRDVSMELWAVLNAIEHPAVGQQRPDLSMLPHRFEMRLASEPELLLDFLNRLSEWNGKLSEVVQSYDLYRR